MKKARSENCRWFAGAALGRVGMALLAVGWVAIGARTALGRMPSCVSGVFPIDASSTLTIDETTSPATVLFTGCEPGTGRVHGARKATRVVATFPSCTGLGRSTRVKVRATIPFPSCSEARAKLTFTRSRMSPASAPPAAGGYSAAVRPVLKAVCAGAGCHGGSTPQQGLDLGSQSSYASIVGRRSVEESRLLLVRPGDPTSSYLLLKVQGAPSIVGARMPLSGHPLSPDQISVIRDWIAAGALDD